MVLVHLAADEVEGVVGLAGVRADPAEVVGDAGLADEAGADGNVPALEGFFQRCRNVVVIAHAQAEVLGLLLGRLAGELAQVAVDLDGHAGDAGLVATGKVLD